MQELGLLAYLSWVDSEIELADSEPNLMQLLVQHLEEQCLQLALSSWVYLVGWVLVVGCLAYKTPKSPMRLGHS